MHQDHRLLDRGPLASGLSSAGLRFFTVSLCIFLGVLDVWGSSAPGLALLHCVSTSTLLRDLLLDATHYFSPHHTVSGGLRNILQLTTHL